MNVCTHERHRHRATTHHAALYLERAHRYRLVDHRLSPHTRFFAAAAVICESLYTTSAGLASLVVSRPSRHFLESLGADLESVNMRLAEKIDKGQMSGSGLDALIVSIEQSRVQTRIRQLRSLEPAAHLTVTSELDRLLWWVSYAMTRSRSTATLQLTLSALRSRFQRPLEFHRQTDREAIGNTLIERLKLEAPRT